MFCIVTISRSSLTPSDHHKLPAVLQNQHSLDHRPDDIPTLSIHHIYLIQTSVHRFYILEKGDFIRRSFPIGCSKLLICFLHLFLAADKVSSSVAGTRDALSEISFCLTSDVP